jgi:ABC-type uncharacterized transport system ATPase subunit
MRPIASGQMRLATRDVSHATPHKLIEAGLSYVPADRHQVGSIGRFNLADNGILKSHASAPFARWRLLRPAAIAAHARRLISDYDIRASGIGVEARVLSGGNLQKLIVAREVTRRSQVLLAVQPTRGLDLATTEFVHHQLLELRSQGVGTLLISTELDEVLALSDRIAVIYEGRIMDIIPGECADRERLGLLMAGVNPAATSEPGTPAAGSGLAAGLATS